MDKQRCLLVLKFETGLYCQSSVIKKMGERVETSNKMQHNPIWHCSCLVHVGGLSLAIEGPSKADISCVDNQDGTCTVSYLPVLPGDYSILVKYNDKHIPGSPFSARITGKAFIKDSTHTVLHIFSHWPGVSWGCFQTLDFIMLFKRIF